MDHQEIIEDSNWWANRLVDHERHDWDIDAENWIEGYKKSVNHPHRKLIIDQLFRFSPFESLLEVGCNCGPNLYCIGLTFPFIKLAGIDPSQASIDVGRKFLPDVLFRTGTVQKLPYHNLEFDIVLTDAVLIYVPPAEIEQAMDELARVAKKAIILVEWEGKSLLGEIKHFHCSINFKKLL